MRSGTSFFDWTVFKKTICRFWPVWGAYFAIWLVLLPLDGLITLRQSTGTLQGAGGMMGSFAVYVPQTAAGGRMALMMVFGVMAAMAVFSHLYNARSANLFGSLPIRREGLFLTHYLAGLACLIVPDAVIFLLTLAVEAAGGYVSMQGLLFWLAVVCGEGLFFYSLAVFCGLFTGHILALPAFYVILNFIVLGVTELLHIVLRAFYYGFSGFTEEVYGVVKWFTPAAKLEESVLCESYYVVDSVIDSTLSDNPVVLETWGLGTVGVYAAAALALSVCAFFLYRARRMESAGDVVSVKAMRPVFKYGVALCAGLAFGMATVVLAGGGEITLMIGIVVWGVIGCFAAQMLLDKSFKVFKKWKGAAAVTAVFIALFLVVGFDLTGFETRVPDPAGVDSVYVSGLDAVYLRDGGDDLRVETADPEVIELLTMLHREMVERRFDDGSTSHNGVHISLNLRYALKGGGSLARSYSVELNPDEVGQEGTAAWIVQRLYDNRELYWQAYGFAQLEEAVALQGCRLESAGYECYDKEFGMSQEAEFYGRDASALLAAVKEDFFAGRIAVRRVDDEEHWYGGSAGDLLTFTAVGREDGDGGRAYQSVQIALQDTASSTLAALEELGGR